MASQSLKILSLLVLLLGSFGCRSDFEDRGQSRLTGASQQGQDRGQFWKQFYSADKSQRNALIKENYCKMRAKVPNFDNLYPGYDPILGYAIAAGAYQEVEVKYGQRLCRKNPGNTEGCYACDVSAGCYNCIYHILKDSGKAKAYYYSLTGDSSFFWKIAKEGRMNECQWARSFSDNFEPAAFNGRLREVGYYDYWYKKHPRTLGHKSQAVLKNAKEMAQIAANAPPGSVVVWGICGTFIKAGCNRLDGIGHIGITDILGFNLGNYVGDLPDGPCSGQNLLGVYIPVVRPDDREFINCAAESEEGQPPEGSSGPGKDKFATDGPSL